MEETYNDIIYISVHTFMCHTEINPINHELFSTLLDEHDGDFRNCNAKIVSPHQGMITVNPRLGIDL